MLKILQSKLGYQFKDIHLLKQALVHRSISREHNERLEFLGDGCLNFIIGHTLYQTYPKATEGELSNLRAHLVKESTLYEIAKTLKIHDFLYLSHGERKNDGAKRPGILADAVEAIIAAIFLDSDFETAQQFVLRIYKQELAQLHEHSFKIVNESVKDPKSRLQEMMQAKNNTVPEYEVVAIEGEDHAQLFKILCKVDNVTTSGTGTSKKRAEQDAAKKMLEKLQ